MAVAMAGSERDRRPRLLGRFALGARFATCCSPSAEHPTPPTSVSIAPA
jgi:hypothetical protein